MVLHVVFKDLSVLSTCTQRASGKFSFHLFESWGTLGLGEGGVGLDGTGKSLG